jgi:hypothetical protein
MEEDRKVLPRARLWALRDSGDENAALDRYEVAMHHHGEVRSILGEMSP